MPNLSSCLHGFGVSFDRKMFKLEQMWHPTTRQESILFVIWYDCVGQSRTNSTGKIPTTHLDVFFPCNVESEEIYYVKKVY